MARPAWDRLAARKGPARGRGRRMDGTSCRRSGSLDGSVWITTTDLQHPRRRRLSVRGRGGGRACSNRVLRYAILSGGEGRELAGLTMVNPDL